MSCIVAYQLAVIVGSRMPEFDLARLRGRERQRGVGLLPEDVRVVGPRVLESVLLGELHQLEHPLVRRIRQNRDAKAEHRASPVAWQGKEHIAGKTAVSRLVMVLKSRIRCGTLWLESERLRLRQGSDPHKGG
jgi:hypothetical protein